MAPQTPSGIDQARELARAAIKRIKAGEPISESARPTVRDIADQWLERHVRGQRTERERARIVSRYIVPRIGDRVFADVRRKDIAELCLIGSKTKAASRWRMGT